jgi:hypothetical protein
MPQHNLLVPEGMAQLLSPAAFGHQGFARSLGGIFPQWPAQSNSVEADLFGPVVSCGSSLTEIFGRGESERGMGEKTSE